MNRYKGHEFEVVVVTDPKTGKFMGKFGYTVDKGYEVVDRALDYFYVDDDFVYFENRAHAIEHTEKVAKHEIDLNLVIE